MIQGVVSNEGVPLVKLNVGARIWAAVIDSGFNGDLELPVELRSALQGRFVGRVSSSLAAGQEIEQDVFLVQFPFDGQMLNAEATFASVDDILVGTGLLKRHRLVIDSPRRTLLIERA